MRCQQTNGSYTPQPKVHKPKHSGKPTTKINQESLDKRKNILLEKLTRENAPNNPKAELLEENRQIIIQLIRDGYLNDHDMVVDGEGAGGVNFYSKGEVPKGLESSIRTKEQYIRNYFLAH